MRKLAAILLLLCSPVAAFCQKGWEQKSFDQWSMSDVYTILSDSPWAQTQVERVDSPLSGSYRAALRLRSAIPIRQALVRQRQLILGYDKFNETDKARFNAETKEVLACSDCSKYYILTLGSSVPMNSSDGVDVVFALKDATLDGLKSYVYLSNETGERRNLVRFIPPKREGAEAMFVFERFDEHGKPLLTAASKILVFSIDGKAFEKKAIPLKKFKFDVGKLVRGGEVVF